MSFVPPSPIELLEFSGTEPEYLDAVERVPDSYNRITSRGPDFTVIMEPASGVLHVTCHRVGVALDVKFEGVSSLVLLRSGPSSLLSSLQFETDEKTRRWNLALNPTFSLSVHPSS